MESVHISEIQRWLYSSGRTDALPGPGGMFLEIRFDVEGTPAAAVDEEFADKVITVESPGWVGHHHLRFNGPTPLARHLMIDRVGRWLLLAVVVLATTVVVAMAPSTTTASAATFACDVPAIARVDIRGFEAAGASPAQVSVALDGSASPAVEARPSAGQ